MQMSMVCRRKDRMREERRSGGRIWLRRAVEREPRKKDAIAISAWSQACGWPLGWEDAPSARITVLPVVLVNQADNISSDD
jgi:hypothetical protein